MTSNDLDATSALGPMPAGRAMTTIDELVVRAPVETIFELARDVARWPDHLPHYRYVRFRETAPDGGGIVEMAAKRPFGPVGWPTWWLSVMRVRGGAPSTGNGGGAPSTGKRGAAPATHIGAKAGSAAAPAVRFRHIGGITTRMDVEWTFAPTAGGTLVRIVHVWDGPRWPVIGRFAATAVIGPVFVHGIASRTLAGLGREAERRARHAT